MGRERGEARDQGRAARPVLSRAQMRAFDRYAIERCGVPGIVLMENAGRGATEIAVGLVAAAEGARVTVVAGTGNNGGDGFVVARHLLCRGVVPEVFLGGPKEKVGGDAAIAMRGYLGLGGVVTEMTPEGDLGPLERALAGSALAVDALFGTGLDRPIEGFYARLVETFNRGPVAKLALDVPSGLDADTGQTLGIVATAHATATFAHLKAGLVTPNGARAAGQVHVVSIGVPGSLVDAVGRLGELVDEGSVRGSLLQRPVGAHKHGAGSVLVLAGSPGKIGAALLAGGAALRAGAGLVTILTWPEAAAALQGRVLEIMADAIDPAALEASIDAALRGRHVVVAGPGFGVDERSTRAIEHVLTHAPAAILDADALTVFAGRPADLARAHGPLILTPHPGEAGRLLGCSTADIEANRFEAARELAARTHATVILKGAHSVIASDGELFVNTSGNAALATAGAGDVLSGVVAALSCTMPPRQSACTGVFVHGAAADLWRDDFQGADRGLLAGEVADRVPRILASLTRRAPSMPI